LISDLWYETCKKKAAGVLMSHHHYHIFNKTTDKMLLTKWV